MNPGHAGQLDVHEDDRRFVDVGLMQGLMTVLGLCHHCQARI